MPIEKTEDLFALTNAALKERLKAEGIEYNDSDTKKELVARLNGDYVSKEQSPADVEAEKAAAGLGETKEARVADVSGDAAGAEIDVEVTTAQVVSDAKLKEASVASGAAKIIGLEGIEGETIEMIDDNKVAVVVVVKEAFKLSGLTVDQWNALSDLERWRYATPVLDGIQAKLYEARSAREDAAELERVIAQNNEARASAIPATVASNPDTIGNMAEPEETEQQTINRLELEKGALQAIVNSVSEHNEKLKVQLTDAQAEIASLTQQVADTQLNLNKVATLHGHIEDLPKL